MFPSLKKLITDHLFLIVALVATIIAYTNTLSFQHISWDDPEMVFRNKDVSSFDVKAFFSGHYVGNYIPLTMLTHAINWLFFGSDDTGHHLVNLLLHLINGCLVYILTLKLFKQKNTAAITVIIFLLHPLQSESVNWISELKNMGYALFYLTGLITYLKYAETKNARSLFYTVLFFILSCLYKPSAVVFPLSLVCIDIIIHKRFDTKLLLYKIPFLFISILFGIINLKTQAADQFINYAHAFPLQERIANAGFALSKYTSLFLAPYNQSVIYPFPTNKLLTGIIGVLFLILVISSLFILYRQKKMEAFAGLLFIVSNLILVLQFIPFGEVLSADRYMYIAIIGFGWLVALLFQKIPQAKLILPILLIVSLGIVSFLRNATWKSSITLYEDIIKKYPNSFVALNSLGAENMLRGNDDKAFMYLNKAIEIAPYNYKGFYNKGLLYLKNNNPKKAIEEFNKTLSLFDYHKAYVGRASAYYMLMQYKDARKDAQAVLMKDKNNHKAYFILGNCANDENDLIKAISFYDRAIELNKDEPDYYFKRAIAFGKLQKFNECVSDLNLCLGINPNYIEAYYWRGVAKVNLKENPCEDLRRAAENNFEAAKGAYAKFCN